ncbi:30S ribosomal protein S6 [Candidatus Collierbacteria bacterium]|nr:30S ribosomal protein S6 [Candidatus Collierbacteria bacterium]
MPKVKKTVKKVVKTEIKPAELRGYDLVVVISSKVKSEKRADAVAVIKQMIEKLGGQLKKTNEMGLKDLAYPIAGEQSGWYVDLEIGLDPQTGIKLEEQMNQSKNVLRHLLIKK